MGFSSAFAIGIAVRVVLILAAGYAALRSLEVEGLAVTRFVAFALLAGAIALLWHHVQRTNLMIARFIEALRHGDVAQRFGTGGGAGFDALGEALNDALRRLGEARRRLADDNRFSEAVVDDAPIALVIVEDGRATLANKAARRMLHQHPGPRIDDFRLYGDAFATMLASAPAGASRLVPLNLDAAPQTAMVSVAIVHRLGGDVRVVAVQPIQGELNAIEIAAQSDLVRILTHEIMNSITPVTSLAESAASLMRQVDRGDDARIADARVAVETLARRADGIMNFVGSYRQISRVPALRRRRIDVGRWAEEIEALFRASSPAPVDFEVRVDAPRLTIDGDPDLLSQVVLNLLRNAAEAAAAVRPEPRVSLVIGPSPRRGVQIDVADNGAGVPDALAKDIFLPFFTTKEAGSGVGLTLARQIVIAHGGSIDLINGEGALFRITL